MNLIKRLIAGLLFFVVFWSLFLGSIAGSLTMTTKSPRWFLTEITSKEIPTAFYVAFRADNNKGSDQLQVQDLQYLAPGSSAVQYHMPEQHLSYRWSSGNTRASIDVITELPGVQLIQVFVSGGGEWPSLSEYRVEDNKIVPLRHSQAAPGFMLGVILGPLVVMLISKRIRRRIHKIMLIEETESELAHSGDSHEKRAGRRILSFLNRHFGKMSFMLIVVGGAYVMDYSGRWDGSDGSPPPSHFTVAIYHKLNNEITIGVGNCDLNNIGSCDLNNNSHFTYLLPPKGKRVNRQEHWDESYSVAYLSDQEQIVTVGYELALFAVGESVYRATDKTIEPLSADIDSSFDIMLPFLVWLMLFFLWGVARLVQTFLENRRSSYL